MYELFSKFSIGSLLQGHMVNHYILTFMSGIPRAFKEVNRRALSTIGTILMLSSLLSACVITVVSDDGSSGGGSNTSAPIVATTPTTPPTTPTPTPTTTSTSRVVISNFVVTTGIKTINFSWAAITSATYYQLQNNPDGTSSFTDLSTRGIVVSPNSTNIRQTNAQTLVSLHRYIPNVTNPQYGVNTCDATSCGTSFRHNTVSLTNAQLNSMIGRLQASNTGAGDAFGYSVSLSGDGNTLAVGAFYEDSSSTGVNEVQNNNSTRTGAVYLFRRIGGAWSQQAHIKASNTGEYDNFGNSVSLSGDGNTLAVGAWAEGGSSTGVNGMQNNNSTDTGAVYVFRFSTDSSTWYQQAYLKASNTERGDTFGISVSLSSNGKTLAVGARGEGSSATGVNGAQDDNTASYSGAVYVFRFSTDLSTWSQQAYIKASNTESGDQFGNSVSLSDDGNTIAVGAIGEGSSSIGVNGAQDDNTATESGAVYLFRFDTISSIWSQQAFIKASNTGAIDLFGISVSLSDDGNILAVGAGRLNEDSSSTGVNGEQKNNSNETGAVYLFLFSTRSSSWSQQAYIKASNTEANDHFGISVSLSDDGNTLAVGAPGEESSATGVGGVDDNGRGSVGATYVFEFVNGAWSQQAYIKTKTSFVFAGFGFSVSLSSNGNTLAVGAVAESSGRGAVYLY